MILRRAIIVAAAVGALLWNAGAAGAGVVMTDDFAAANGPNDLITNQYALWTDDPAAVRSPLWEMTSGSLFSVDGLGWTGDPDAVVPNATSSNGTGSQVFRLRTRAEFGSVRQAVSVRINGYDAPPGGAKGWDGVVLWARYKTEFALYFAYILRRDGRVQLTKKCPGSVPGGNYYNGGTYFALTALTPSLGSPEIGRWYRLASTVRDNPDGSVSIAVYRDGVLLASATDAGVGCDPLTGPARLGVRGDNANFNLDAYRVYDLQR